MPDGQSPRVRNGAAADCRQDGRSRRLQGCQSRHHPTEANGDRTPKERGAIPRDLRAGIGGDRPTRHRPQHVRANPAFCTMLGYEEDELLGMKIADITAPEDVQSSVESTRGLYTGERSSSDHGETIPAQGRWPDLGRSVRLARAWRRRQNPSAAWPWSKTSPRANRPRSPCGLRNSRSNHAGVGVFWCDPDGPVRECQRLPLRPSGLFARRAAGHDGRRRGPHYPRDRGVTIG